MNARIAALLLLVFVLPSPTQADGMLYQLPDDGHWVRFDLNVTAAQAGSAKFEIVGTLTMKSVGVTQVEGKDCRWIEIVVDAKRAGEPITQVDKLLIPEEHLGRGKSPLKHVLRASRKDTVRGVTKTQEYHEGDGGAFRERLEWLLPSSFKEPMELKVETIDTQTGKLDCSGISASEKVKQSGGVTVDSRYAIRLNERAPFGVVTCDLSAAIEQNGQAVGTMKSQARLVDFGTDAKSLIPDAK